MRLIEGCCNQGGSGGNLSLTESVASWFKHVRCVGFHVCTVSSAVGCKDIKVCGACEEAITQEAVRKSDAVMRGTEFWPDLESTWIRQWIYLEGKEG